MPDKIIFRGTDTLGKPRNTASLGNVNIREQPLMKVDSTAPATQTASGAA